MKQFVLMMAAAAMMCCQNAQAQNKVKNIYTENKTLNVGQVVNTDEAVQVNRYLIAGYNSLCWPLSMTGEQLTAQGIKAERLAAIQQEGSTLCLYFVDCTSEGIEAGMPYLVYSSKTQYLRARNTEAVHTSSEAKTIRMTDGQGNQVAFSSSWETRQKDGLYGIPARQNVTPLESVLVRTSSDLSFLPTRCGFNWEQQSATAERLEIRHVSEQDITGLRLVSTSDNTSSEAYDLSGRRLSNSAKGLTIVNGKKVIQ